MANRDKNIDGETAESLVHGRINRQGYPFRAKRLSAKWPVIDLYVEFDYKDLVYYFFLQVKSTQSGLTPKGMLRVQAKKNDLNKLTKYNAPTYFIGVNLEDEASPAFILTVRKKKYESGFTVMHSDQTNELSKTNLYKLRREVIKFWQESTDDKVKIKYLTNFEK